MKYLRGSLVGVRTTPAHDGSGFDLLRGLSAEQHALIEELVTTPGRRPPRLPVTIEEPSWVHGTYGGYTNHGCRCDPCRAARAEYAARYRRGAA